MPTPLSWTQEFSKIVAKLLIRKDSEPFREPVNWQLLGLDDYLEVVKHPMDLGTVKKNLEMNVYSKREQCAADIRLIWSNALLYNSPGSKIYIAAKSLSDYFETTYSSYVVNDINRPPSIEEMTTWIENCHKINIDELKSILSILKKKCPRCLLKSKASKEVTIEVDLIPISIYRQVYDMIQDSLPDVCPTPSNSKATTKSTTSGRASTSGGTSSTASSHNVQSTSTSNKLKTSEVISTSNASIPASGVTTTSTVKRKRFSNADDSTTTATTTNVVEAPSSLKTTEAPAASTSTSSGTNKRGRRSVL